MGKITEVVLSILIMGNLTMGGIANVYAEDTAAPPPSESPSQPTGTETAETPNSIATAESIPVTASPAAEPLRQNPETINASPAAVPPAAIGSEKSPAAAALESQPTPSVNSEVPSQPADHVEPEKETASETVEAVVLAAVPAAGTPLTAQPLQKEPIILKAPAAPTGPIVANGTYYNALQTAINSIANGASGSIQVLSSIDISNTGGMTPSGADINNGRTIALILGPGVVVSADGYIGTTAVSTGSIVIAEGCTLNLKSSDEANPGTIAAKKNAGGNFGYTMISDSGTMTIDHVNIDTTESELYPIQLSGRGNLTMNSGEIDGQYSDIVVLNSWTPSGGQENPTGGMSVTINGGTLNATDDVAVSQYGPGEVTVNGGTLVGSYGAVYAAQGTVNINGGILTSTGTGSDSATVWVDDSHVTKGSSTRPYMPTVLNIKDGKFSAANDQNLIVDIQKGELKVVPLTGGYYSTDYDIKPFVDYPDGYEVLPNPDPVYLFRIGKTKGTQTPASTGSAWTPSYLVTFLDCHGSVVSSQWVGQQQAANIPAGYTYDEPELSWVYRDLTVSPTGCRVAEHGYVPPNTADRSGS